MRSWLLLVLLFLCGCGGSGGRSTSLRIATTWGASGAQSQRVSFVGPDGTVLDSRIFGRDLTDVAIRVPKATTIVRIELNAGANFAGAITGITETEYTGQAQLATLPGAAVATLAIKPDPLTLSPGASAQVAIEARTTDGSLAFVDPATLAVTVSGGVATLSPNRLLTGTDFGDAQLQASSGSRTASLDVRVAAAGARRNRWTVLVFLSSANNLYPFSDPNVDQMERVTTDDVRFVVQWKQAKRTYPESSFDGTRRYLVRPDTRSGVRSQLVQDLGNGVDMGRAETLRDFIAWGKANYPADRYALVIWSHGSGWSNALSEPVRATSFDDEFGSAINVWDLPTALNGNRFDILSFDACLMQMMEVTTELAPYAKYFAASAENTPAAGYAYDRVFAQFAQDPGASTRTLAESMVPAHVENPPYRELFVTQSVIDSAGLPTVQTALNGLAGALTRNRVALLTIIPEVRSGAPKYGFAGDGRNFYDAGDLAQRLKDRAGVPEEVKVAAQGVLDALPTAVTRYGGTSRNAWSRGLGIDFSSAATFRPSDYARLRFARETDWDAWLAVAP